MLLVLIKSNQFLNYRMFCVIMCFCRIFGVKLGIICSIVGVRFVISVTVNLSSS